MSHLEPRFDGLGPKHLLHLFLLFYVRGDTYPGGIKSTFGRLGYYYVPDQGWHRKVFEDFFSDPKRSGKFCLGAQHHAEIVALYIRYGFNSNVTGLCQRLRITEGSRRRIFGDPDDDSLGYNYDDANRYEAIAKHLSLASISSVELIELICRYYPDTFPVLSGPLRVYSYLDDDHHWGRLKKSWEGEGRQALNKAMTRYLLVCHILNLYFAQSWIVYLYITK